MKHSPFIIFYLFLNLFIYAFQGTIWVYIFCFILFSAVIVWGSFDIQLGYFVNSFTHKRTKIKEVALTFDDGPTEFTPKFLDLLKENNIKATFFCIGKQIEKYPETFKRIIGEGHSIGNHTYSHSNNTGFLSTSKMIEEIQKCDEVMLKIGNSKTNLYRPPFGVTNPNISKAIKKMQKKSNHCTFCFQHASKPNKKALNFLKKLNEENRHLHHRKLKNNPQRTNYF